MIIPVKYPLEEKFLNDIVKVETYIGNDLNVVAINDKKEDEIHKFTFLMIAHQDQDDSWIFINYSICCDDHDAEIIKKNPLYIDNIKKDPTQNEIYTNLVATIKDSNTYISDLYFEDSDKELYKVAHLLRKLDDKHYVMCNLFIHINTFMMFEMFMQFLLDIKNPQLIFTDHNFNSMKYIYLDYIEMQSSCLVADTIYTYYEVHSGVTGYNFIVSSTISGDIEEEDLLDPLHIKTFEAMYGFDNILASIVPRKDKIYLVGETNSFLSNNPLGAKKKNDKKEFHLFVIDKDICKRTNLLDRLHNVVKGH